jgi:metacaspase-1
MPLGLAVCAGLDSVDPAHYAGWRGRLNAAEADAVSMAAVAESQGFVASLLLTREATREALFGAIQIATTTCGPGDFFLLSFAGHGAQLPRADGTEVDGLDETWCLYDAECIDDELREALGAFAPGVRVLVISDSCSSGTVIVEEDPAGSARPLELLESYGDTEFRAAPPDIARRTYTENRAFYDSKLRRRPLVLTSDSTQPSVLSVSSCQDDQLAVDGYFNGLFTRALLGIWDGGRFAGDYRTFFSEIASLMPSYQTPRIGWAYDENPGFLRERPFTI